jgi:hypothetical protein
MEELKMKRLIKSDYYNEKEQKRDIRNELKTSAIQICQKLNIDSNLIKEYDVNIRGDQVGIEFGNVQEDGFDVSVSAHVTGEINKITLSVRQQTGKITYIHSTEQSILELFLEGASQFVDWVDEQIELIANI